MASSLSGNVVSLSIRCWRWCLLLSLLVGANRAESQGPELRRLFPPGVQRGQSIEVRALGNAPTWPVQVWSESNDLVWEPQAEKGVFRVTATPNSRMGIHRLRFYDPDGATSVLRFHVGCIQEANEVEPNDEPKTATSNPATSLLWNGVLEKRGDVDLFALEAKAGQTIVASLIGQQQLRAPMDACLQLLNERGNVIVENHDTIGLDPMLTYPVTKDGKYFLRTYAFPEAPDSSIGYSGADTYVYRLTVSTQPFVRGSRPLAVFQQQPTTIELLGWNIPESALAHTVASSGEQTFVQWTADGFANYLELPVSQAPVATETASADGTLQTIPAPGSVTGSLQGIKEVDRYRFTATKDSKWNIRVASRTLGYTTDLVLRILDASGTQLARDDDSNGGIDASLTWQSPADGDYQLEVSDLYGHGGSDYLYRIELENPSPDVKLRVEADSFKGTVNTAVEIPVSIDRLNGFASPVKLAVTGLPATAKCDPVISAAEGDSSKSVKLLVTGTEKFSGPISIVGTVEGTPEVSRKAFLSTDTELHLVWLNLK